MAFKWHVYFFCHFHLTKAKFRYIYLLFVKANLSLNNFWTTLLLQVTPLWWHQARHYPMRNTICSVKLLSRWYVTLALLANATSSMPYTHPLWSTALLRWMHGYREAQLLHPKQLGKLTPETGSFKAELWTHAAEDKNAR